MSVVHDLIRIKHILERLKERPDVVEITGYDKVALEMFLWGLNRAIKRYRKESERVKRHLRRARN